MVEIYSIMKNEERILPLYLEHYQTAFPGCVINVYDNGSTDGSVELCRSAGCNIGIFPKYDELLLQEFKNTIWKKSKADWIIVCDVDELLQVNQADLDQLGDVDVIWFKGYTMIDVDGTQNPRSFHTGCASPPYDKCAMFRSTVRNMNYSIGAHLASPVPAPRYSKHNHFLLHYSRSWFTLDNFLKRFPKSPKIIIEKSYRELTKERLRVK